MSTKKKHQCAVFFSVLLLAWLVTNPALAETTPYSGMRSLQARSQPSLVFYISAVTTVLFLAIFAIYQHRNLAAVDKRIQGMRSALLNREYDINAIVRLVSLISGKISEKHGLAGLLDGITKICVDVFKSDRVSFMIYDKSSFDLVLCSVNGSAGKDILDTRVKLGEGVAGWAAVNRRSLILNGTNNEANYPGLKLENPSIKYAMIAPVVLNNELIGVLNLCTYSDDIVYGNADLRDLTSIARAAGLCIVHTTEYIAGESPRASRTRSRLEHAERAKEAIVDIVP